MSWISWDYYGDAAEELERVNASMKAWTDEGWTLEHVTQSFLQFSDGASLRYGFFWIKND